MGERHATLSLALVSLALAGAAPVSKVVVLMMENRSFDHLLGWLTETCPAIDGIDGSEYNLVQPDDPTSEKVYVNKNGYDVGPDDPDHTLDGTDKHIYGLNWEKSIPSSSDDENQELPTPTMDGYVWGASELGESITNPMSMFTPDENSAPILNTLALEFGVFDKWYASAPTSTDPNRAFAMSGTCNGDVENYNGTLWKQQSYFDFLNNYNKSWQAIYDNDLWAIMYFEDMHNKKNSRNVKRLSTFYDDLSQGILPDFTWIQPSMTGTLKNLPNWQHPDASVREGERLIKNLYESLRNSSVWEDVLFLITYDEHGGFYDHVPPPQVGVPNPDGINNKETGFDFTRLGIRIPTLAISSHIPKNTIIHEPDELLGKPYETSQFESTSILSSTNRLFNINNNLTKRDEWAGIYNYILTDEARQDCPLKLPDVQPPDESEYILQRNKKLNHHMDIQVSFYCQHNYPNIQLDECRSKYIINQGIASDFIIIEAEKFLKKVQKYDDDEKDENNGEE
jgi:phospholipase C